jgi:hypothetical protein
VSVPSAALSICVSIEICTISVSPWNSVASSSPALASLDGLSFSAPNSIVANSNATRLASGLIGAHDVQHSRVRQAAAAVGSQSSSEQQPAAERDQRAAAAAAGQQWRARRRGDGEGSRREEKQRRAEAREESSIPHP